MEGLVFSLLQLFTIILTTRFCLSSSRNIPCNNASIPSSKRAHFEGMFVFGNSIVDNGNNNYLESNTIKANYLPYGIDFKPNGAKGRFTNNKNFADYVGELLKLPLVPAFSDPLAKGVAITHGVNHASAGSGIVDVTNSNKGRSSLNQQIQNFMNVTLPDLQAQRPGYSTKDLLRNYLFLFSTGSDDFLANYFQGISPVSFEYFTENLTTTLASQLTELYNVGARKVVYLNLGPLGCNPMIRVADPNKECYSHFLNYVAFFFNTLLNQMLDRIKAKLPGFEFVVVNYFQIGLEHLEYPSRGGFTNVNDSCCEVTKQSGGVLCKKGGSICANRNNYVFFDGFHPTETLQRIMAIRAFKSNDTSEVYPFNIQKLAKV